MFWTKTTTKAIMIKIQKSEVEMPLSLTPATSHFFSDGKFPEVCETTHKARLYMVSLGEYSDKADSRYKLKDIKDALVKLYNRKCVYCESRMHRNDLEVEHYRPKRHYPTHSRQASDGHQPHEGYYWLSLSWDNLLLSCGDCNRPKSSIFDIDGPRAEYANADHCNWERINSLSDKYNLQEKPKLLNPEKEDPRPHFEFQRNGHITGTTPRGIYTNNLCKLDRDELVEDRREILEGFRKEILSALKVCADNADAITLAIKTAITNFKTKTQDPKTPFIAFRKAAIKNGWLKEIVKEVRG